jgi:alginate O-acetyltransferase complex protein AlgI
MAALASYIFYSWWYPPYVIILLALTFFAYVTALLPRQSSGRFALMVAVTFLPLCFYKYLGFLIANINAVLGTHLDFPTSWQLPLGISFITFTAGAYLVDVRHHKLEPESDFTRFALYMSFFPQLIAGPIMRPRELLPQLNHLFFKPKMLKFGLFLFAIGMIKKVVFADQIATWVDHFYRMQSPADLPHSLFAFYGFSVQIYCDFSGYTDMALGLAFMLGIRLPLNFNRPYIAQSVREFWRRWHITLSRWLRDYLYIPLGGNRKGYGRTVLALMLTMTLGGLWHGAAWTFVIWGMLHGLFLMTEHAVKRLPVPQWRVPTLFKQLWTFHIVSIAWILFRARNWSEVHHMLSGFFVAGDWQGLFPVIAFPVFLIILYFVLQRWDRISFVLWMVRRLPAPVIYGLTLILILAAKVISVGSPSAFIYFDF